MPRLSLHKALQTLILLMAIILPTPSSAQQAATLRVNASTVYQHITGFGGFVCSPQFGYGHMSDADIKKVWGTTSTVGCNIMRLYIPIGRNAWSQSLHTAKLAKQMGLKVFASPWGQPAEWKTNGTINAKNSDGTTGKLKRENWGDYAKYLDDYVSYLRENGVELDAISIQNEPDWPASYAGCLWSASEIAQFVKLYGRQINCKIMAPETLGVSDSYANELAKSDILPNFDIYGGHQYGGLQSSYKNLGKKGKELWMTEYLINWNENSSSNRNFNYDLDVFNFARSINTCLLNDFNAWIHYAAKRYYGMLGDGTNGTSSGNVTKRGYVMAHFARFVTGLSRVAATWSDDSAQPLEGSVYLSDKGDTVVAVVFNEAKEAKRLKVDLPFYTLQGEVYTTTRQQSMKKTELTYDVETCRPEVDIAAASIVTLRFVRSKERQPSNMTATVRRFDKIDDMTTTKSTFGTSYKMSGKTLKLDHSNAIISNKTSLASGYVQLSDRFDQLVLQVKRVSSTMNYSSAKTTLNYVNAAGELASHNYGDIDLSRQQNINLVFDLSPATLTDGCIGLVSLTNDNWSSALTLTLGDVYLSNGGLYSATLSGDFVADDSNMLDFSEDATCTSLDLSAVGGLTGESALQLANTNAVVFLPEGSQATFHNAIIGNTCAKLVLHDDGGAYRPTRSFTASDASLTCHVEGRRLLAIPFQAAIPQQAKAYRLIDQTDTASPCFQLQLLTDSIPANEPVMIEANGEVTFSGKGETGAYTYPVGARLRGTYTGVPLYAGDYVLTQKDDKWRLSQLKANSSLPPFGVYANMSGQSDFVEVIDDPSGIEEQMLTSTQQPAIYDLQGRRIASMTATGTRGILIEKDANGRTRKIVRR